MVKNNDLLVSVLIPVYNGGKTIGRAIKSISFQSYSNWKCIIVNDGSTDDTSRILENIKDSRFKIINLSKNSGRGAARQIALDNSEGDLIAFLDADDFYHQDKLLKQLEVFINNPDTVLVSCGQGSFDKTRRKLRVRSKGSGSIQKFIAGEKIRFACAASMMKRKHAILFKYNHKLNAAEDIDFISRILEGNSYLVLPDTYYYYSEYESVSKQKMLGYYSQTLKKQLFELKLFDLSSIKKIISALSKFIFMLFTLPFFSTDYYIDKRGNLPTNKDIEDFKLTLQKLEI